MPRQLHITYLATLHSLVLFQYTLSTVACNCYRKSHWFMANWIEGSLLPSTTSLCFGWDPPGPQASFLFYLLSLTNTSFVSLQRIHKMVTPSKASAFYCIYLKFSLMTSTKFTWCRFFLGGKVPSVQFSCLLSHTAFVISCIIGEMLTKYFYDLLFTAYIFQRNANFIRAKSIQTFFHPSFLSKKKWIGNIIYWLNWSWLTIERRIERILWRTTDIRWEELHEK